ncbi:hypothetical protein Bca4012_020374 [Brassica carinata]
MKHESKGRMVQKAQIRIVLEKSDNFDSLVPPVTNGKTPEEVAKAASPVKRGASVAQSGGGVVVVRNKC